MSRSSRKRRKARLLMQSHDPKWIAIRNLLAVHSVKMRYGPEAGGVIRDKDGKHIGFKSGYTLYVGRPPRETYMGSINEDATLEEWISACSRISRGELVGMMFMHHGTQTSRFNWVNMPRRSGKLAALAAAYGQQRPRLHGQKVVIQTWDEIRDIEARIAAAIGINFESLTGRRYEDATEPPAQPAPRKGWRGYRPTTVSQERQRLPEESRARRALYRK